MPHPRYQNQFSTPYIVSRIPRMRDFCYWQSACYPHPSETGSHSEGTPTGTGFLQKCEHICDQLSEQRNSVGGGGQTAGTQDHQTDHPLCQITGKEHHQGSEQCVREDVIFTLLVIIQHWGSPVLRGTGSGAIFE